MPLMTQPFEVREFSGGLTDDHNSPIPNVYLKMDNLLLNSNGLPFSRYGSLTYNSAQLPSGTQRVAKIVNYNNDDTLIVFSGSRAFYDNAGTWTEILSPAGGVALPGASTASNFQTVEWKRQVFITSDSQIQPIKIIKDDTYGWRSITAGLPKMAATPSYVSATLLASAITAANATRTAILDHFALTPAHTIADTISGASVPTACTNLPTLLALVNSLALAYSAHNNDAWAGGKYHSRENLAEDAFSTDCFYSQSDQTLFSISPASDLVSVTVLLNDLMLKYTCHMGHLDTHHGGSAFNFSHYNYYLVDQVNGPYVTLDITYFINLVNTLRGVYSDHLADGGAGTQPHKAVDVTNVVSKTVVSPYIFPITVGTPPDAIDIPSIISLLRLLMMGYNDHNADAEQNAGWTYHVGKNSTPHKIYPGSGVGASELYSFADGHIGGWDRDNGQDTSQTNGNTASSPPTIWTKILNSFNTLIEAYNGHVNDTASHRQASISSSQPHSMPSLANTHLLSGYLYLANYNYAIVYSYTYTINGVKFITKGEPIYFTAQGVVPVEYQAAVVRNIPPLVNTGATNYDVANVTIEVYRTINNGTTYFLAGTLVNTGSTALTYSDIMKDADLINQQILYTNGGVLPNSLPPQAKFISISGANTFYGNFSSNPSRILQSQAFIPDGVYGGSFVDLPYDVKGLASFRGIPLAWTANQTFRIDGNFDSQGNGQLSAIPIATNVGLSGSFSPVVYDNGVVFAAQDGIYLTDGYRVQKINTYWRTSYLNLIRTQTIASQMHGVYERNQRRVWWCTNINSGDNDSLYVLDANFPVTENARFTTASGGSNFTSSAIGYFKNQMIRGGAQGYVFKHDPSYTSDPKVNVGTSPSTWSTRWITYSYQSPYFDFGTLLLRKWNPRVNVKAKNLGDLSLQVNLFTDDNTNEVSALSPLFYRGGSDIIEQRGHVPAGYLRCRNRSLQLTNAFVILQNSDTKGTATLDHTAKTLTLGGAWTGDLVDQFVTFSGDGYIAQWLITAQAGAVLTLSDPGGTLPATGVTKWEIKGYPKTEQFQLVSYALHVATLGGNQPVMGSSTGANS